MWICSYGVVNCPECKRTGEDITEFSTAGDRIYFRIRYADKEEAKKLGARWDPDQRMWYSPLRNPNLSAMGKKWRVAQPPAANVTPPKPQAAARLPAGRAVPKEQLSLESLLTVPTNPPPAEPEPIPGSIPYEEFMAAIRAADEAEAQERLQARERLGVQLGVQSASAKESRNAR